MAGRGAGMGEGWRGFGCGFRGFGGLGSGFGGRVRRLDSGNRAVGVGSGQVMVNQYGKDGWGVGASGEASQDCELPRRDCHSPHQVRRHVIKRGVAATVRAKVGRRERSGFRLPGCPARAVGCWHLPGTHARSS